jgi:FtsP/CotA-like multicopper oxidase with cupredoxin domain
MQVNRRLIAVLCVTVAASGILVALGYAGLFNQYTFTGTTVHFTIIENSVGPMAGYNGSANYSFSTPWPVLEVNQGERVIIHVFNNSTVEAHGFAIVHYYEKGIALSEHQSYNVEFIANDVGNFTIYCNIHCSIHPLMQNGRLIVNPQPSSGS